MPTSTFENLPPPKKERIIEAAIDEFARYRYSDASINRIVKAAGIPRGSFYQYFSGKEDLYMLILDKIGHEKLEIFSRYPKPSGDITFFEAALASIPGILEWIELCPRYNQIGMLMAQDDSEFIRRIVGQMGRSQSEVLEYLRQDQRKGLVRKDVDLDLVIEMILPLATSLLQDFYSKGGREEALEKIKQVFEILIYGIAEKGVQHAGNHTSGGSLK
ncbi:TetR/AcrR family transcriptional regulator [Lachnospiraceae bacterium ASD3451]|uniref:TetR/AcrR family transcriptional regulator n=1 Tax=Diplocloster agilis TaxID=2850323 RepID=UPI001DED24A1|nr:TetR/AcrR family transcriptional regulator [Diplocloster agilis]MBU9744860.1 TetR/AcrR family transcriptional regulator [Diplocloster agilis]